MKVKEIDKMFEENNDKLVKAKKLRSEALKLAEEYSMKAEEAANAGDADKYLELMELSNKQKAIAYVYQKQIDQFGTVNVSKADVAEAWKDYAKQYSKSMKMLNDEFQKEKEKLLKKYIEMVDLQDEACSVRERLGSYIGKTRVAMSVDGGFGTLFPMDHIGGFGDKVDSWISINGSSIKDPDAVYYLSSLGLNGLQLPGSSECKKIQNVVLWRVASK